MCRCINAYVNLISELTKTFFRISIFILISLFLGFELNLHLHFIYLIPFLILATIIFLSFSMIFAALLLYNWRFMHLIGVFISISTIFSGAFYPTIFLPSQIRNIAAYMPFAFVVENLRSLLTGNSKPFFILLYMSFAAITIGIVSYMFFTAFENYSKKRGTILHY